MLGSSKWSLYLRFPHQNPICTHTCNITLPILFFSILSPQINCTHQSRLADGVMYVRITFCEHCLRQTSGARWQKYSSYSSLSLAVAQDGHLQRVTIPEAAYVQSASLTSWWWADCARNMQRNLILYNLCEWTRNLCIKLVIIKKLYYDARPTKYQDYQQISTNFK